MKRSTRDLYGYTNRCYHYEWEIKATTCQAIVELQTRFGGDAQLYMKFGSKASESSYDAKSTRPGSHELIAQQTLEQGHGHGLLLSVPVVITAT